MPWLSVLHVLAFVAGVALILLTLLSAIRSFVLPRNESVLLTNLVVRLVRFVFDAIAALGRTYAQRDRVLALYAPVALVALPISWLFFLALAYANIFWAIGEGSWGKCYETSNSFLLTLGFKHSPHLRINVFGYSESALGLLLLTLLLSYIPTIYQTFSRRELVVARLELRAGTPASAGDLLLWLNRNGNLTQDEAQWAEWEEWFVEIEETHTSLPIISFFRSPQPGRSWVTAAGIILDTAALMFSVTDRNQRNRQAELCFKAGCIAMNRVYRFFESQARSKPSKLVDGGDPLEAPDTSDFDHVLDQLRENDFPIPVDQAAAWKHYRELRSRYEEAVVFLAKLTLAPEVKPVSAVATSD